MKISIKKLTNLSHKALQNIGFAEEEAKLMTENLMEGELTGKKSHGVMRVSYFKKKVGEGRIKLSNEDVEIKKETPISLLVDGKDKTGLYVVNKALELGLEKVKKSKLLIVGTTNTAPMSGMIGQYARKAADHDLIFIGMNNSPARISGLVPHGSIKRMLGTNPLTIGVPTNDIPVILDMASSKITVGDVIVANKEGKKLPEGTALDNEGNMTTEPTKAMDESYLGGILPIAEHKGSGLAMIVELLGGALTESRCGHNVEGGWGSLFILIDPNILRPIDEFKRDVETFIKELKSAPKMKGVNEIHYPGQKSQSLRKKHLQEGKVEIGEKILEELTELAEGRKL